MVSIIAAGKLAASVVIAVGTLAASVVVLGNHLVGESNQEVAS